MTLDINIVGCDEDIAEIERRYDAGDPVAKFLIDNSSIREKPQLKDQPERLRGNRPTDTCTGQNQ